MKETEHQALNRELLAVNDDLRSQIEELRGINGDLKNLVNATEIGTILLDRDLRIERFTPRARDVFVIAEADLGRPLDDLDHHFQSDELVDDCARVLRELAMVERVMQDTVSHKWFLIRLLPFHTVGGEAEGVVITLVDITKQKENDAQLEALVETLEEMVASRAEQVTQLAAELSRAEHTERQRIARILHDDLQQLLHALRIRVGVLSRGLSRKQADRLSQANTLVSRAIDVTRNLTVDLSPPVLDEEEFTAVLAWLGLQMENMHGLNVEVVAPGPVLLPMELRSPVYQMVRELLFNVVKHAQIDRARVLIDQEEDRLVLVVSDEGTGFDVGQEQAPSKKSGFGLPTVRRRLQILGGRLELDAAPGSGTTARLVVPLSAYADGAAAGARSNANDLRRSNG